MYGRIASILVFNKLMAASTLPLLAQFHTFSASSAKNRFPFATKVTRLYHLHAVNSLMYFYNQSARTYRFCVNELHVIGNMCISFLNTYTII